LFIHLLKVLKQDEYLLRNLMVIKNTYINWWNKKMISFSLNSLKCLINHYINMTVF